RSGSPIAPSRVDRSSGGSRLRWRDRSQGVSMRELQVIDAAGRTLFSGLPSESSGLLTIPTEALRGASYPVTISTLVGPELPVADPVYGKSFGGRGSVGIAWNGTEYLAIWG